MISVATCFDCKKKNSKIAYLNKRDEKIAYAKKRRKEKSYEIKKKRCLKYLSDRERIKERAKKYYEQNKEIICNRRKLYRSRLDVHNKIIEKNRIRKTLIRAIEKSSDITLDFILDLKKNQINCQICSVEMSDSVGDRQRHLDHIVPICIGGTHTKNNVRYVCRSCNLKRPKDGSDINIIIVERYCEYTGNRDIIKNGEKLLWEEAENKGNQQN